MRWKIIFVNGGIVLVLALLTYFLLHTSLESVVANRGEQKAELGRALRAAESQLALDALQMERWLARKADEGQSREVFAGGTAQARSQAATKVANALRDEAVAESEFAKMAPSMVLFVDERGLGVGRNGSALMRGDDVGQTYPALLDSLKSKTTGSDVWINTERQEQMLVSFAPISSESGEVKGAVVVGTPLNDERLARTSDLTSGQALAFVKMINDEPAIVAVTGDGASGAREGAVLNEVKRAVGSTNSVVLDQEIAGRLYGAIGLEGYGKSQAAILASVPASRVASIANLLWPVFAVAGLGLLLVTAAGIMLGNWVSRPIAEMEEGMLLIINGNQDIRFELEHAELGGLASRINALLNALLGVAEDNTDAQGRPSTAPSGREFGEALAVDESSVSTANVDHATSQALANEPAEQYYTRLYSEYIQAKRKLGDPVDHISSQAFRGRITKSEQEMLAKHGRPVRYQVELKEGAVVLIAVPLPGLAG